MKKWLNWQNVFVIATHNLNITMLLLPPRTASDLNRTLKLRLQLSADYYCRYAEDAVSRCTVIYLTFTMALGTISVCLTVMVLNLHHRDSENPVPRWVQMVVLEHLARILHVTPHRPNSHWHHLTSPNSNISTKVSSAFSDQ